LSERRWRRRPRSFACPNCAGSLSAEGRGGILHCRACLAEYVVEKYDEDQPRDEQGQWTDGGGGDGGSDDGGREAELSRIDQRIDALPSVGGSADSVRNPLLPKDVEITGDEDDDEEAILEFVTDEYDDDDVVTAIHAAGKDSPGDIRSIPLNRIDTQQATLSKAKLREYVRSNGWEKEAGIAVRYGRRFIMIDGNHRVVALMMRGGATSANLRIVYDKSKPKKGLDGEKETADESGGPLPDREAPDAAGPGCLPRGR
jgi:hypothetical protein